MFIFCWLWGGRRVAEGVAEVAIERFFNAKSRFLHTILHKSNLIFIAQPTKKAVNAQPEASAWLGLTTDYHRFPQIIFWARKSAAFKDTAWLRIDIIHGTS